jgi:hypothetical protein
VVHYVPYQESDPTEGFAELEGYSQAEAALGDGGYDEFASDEEVPY